MEISQKLALSKRADKIYFFREGIFVQVFGPSLYMMVAEFELVIKVIGIRYKKLNNELILRAGLPSHALEKRFNNLTRTDFGYTMPINSHFAIQDYIIWYQAQLAAVLKNEAQKQAELAACNATSTYIAVNNIDNPPHSSVPASKNLLLTEQEYDFLKNWQQDKYPACVESGFLRGLSQKLT